MKDDVENRISVSTAVPANLNKAAHLLLSALALPSRDEKKGKLKVPPEVWVSRMYGGVSKYVIQAFAFHRHGEEEDKMVIELVVLPVEEEKSA